MLLHKYAYKYSYVVRVVVFFSLVYRCCWVTELLAALCAASNELGIGLSE